MYAGLLKIRVRFEGKNCQGRSGLRQPQILLGICRGKAQGTLKKPIRAAVAINQEPLQLRFPDAYHRGAGARPEEGVSSFTTWNLDASWWPTRLEGNGLEVLSAFHQANKKLATIRLCPVSPWAALIRRWSGAHRHSSAALDLSGVLHFFGPVRWPLGVSGRSGGRRDGDCYEASCKEEPYRSVQ